MHNDLGDLELPQRGCVDFDRTWPFQRDIQGVLGRMLGAVGMHCEPSMLSIATNGYFDYMWKASVHARFR